MSYLGCGSGRNVNKSLIKIPDGRNQEEHKQNQAKRDSFSAAWSHGVGLSSAINVVDAFSGGVFFDWERGRRERDSRGVCGRRTTWRSASTPFM